MKTFKDNADRTWTIVVHVTAVKRCRALAEVDLYGLVNDGLQGLGRLLGDPVALVDVLYVLCKDEADKRGVTDEDFGRAMAGDAIEHATKAFLEELTDFFPDPRVRAGLQRTFDAIWTATDRQRESLAANLDAIPPDPDPGATRSTEPSGNSPES
jgi:hypothetical protein